jgi:hypothetical protein
MSKSFSIVGFIAAATLLTLLVLTPRSASADPAAEGLLCEKPPSLIKFLTEQSYR